jgi:hypothetical protein
VIPLIIRADGTISKSLKKCPSNILGKHEIKKLQTAAHWALHTHFTKQYCNYKTLKMRNNIYHKL